jgi:hypothetical protein
MAHQDLSSTGIVTGQIVEATEITQFVNALTGQPVGGKGYDITISGSLNLTGSLLMTGSLVNEFTGQFKTLGLGVVAPNEPTMLHVKTTDASNDPLVLIESDVASGDSMIYAKNLDTEWRYGLSGADDSFTIKEYKGATLYSPFTIGTTTPNYTLQVFNEVLGVGMGGTFSSNPSNLSAGSFQSSATISGSLIEGNIISASSTIASTVTIHGTASDAAYATQAGLVSSINLGQVVMTGANTSAFSGSGNFNSSHNIISNGGRIEGTYVRYKNVIEDTGGNTVIQGNIDSLGYISIGDINSGGSGNGPIMKIDSSEDKTFFTTDDGTALNDVHIMGNLTGSEDIRISGSATPLLVVGPNAGLPQSNNASSSLSSTALYFARNGGAVLGNSRTDANASLQFSIGGNVAAEISQSQDFTINHQLNVLNSGTNDNTRCTYIYGDNITDSDARGKMLWRIEGSQTSGASSIPIWEWNPSNASNEGVYVFKYSVMGTQFSSSPTTDQVWFQGQQLVYWSGTSFSEIGDSQSNIKGSSLSAAVFNMGLGNGNLSVEAGVTGVNTYTIKWMGWVEVEYMMVAP